MTMYLHELGIYPRLQIFPLAFEANFLAVSAQSLHQTLVILQFFWIGRCLEEPIYDPCNRISAELRQLCLFGYGTLR